MDQATFGLEQPAAGIILKGAEMMNSKKMVVLFHPRTFHEQNYRYYHVPYSLLSISSLVNRDKYEIVIWDNNLIQKDDFKPLLSSLGENLFCVGISSMIGYQIADGLSFAKQVRNYDKDIPIIWGGPLPTVLPEITINNPLVDIIVKGQGQITFPELLNGIEKNTLNEVNGIEFKENGITKKTNDRLFIGFNNFPEFSSVYDLVDLSSYIRADEHISDRTISFHSSQGCPFNCGFCSEVALWNHRWGGFSADKVVKDIRYLVKNFNINGIKFYDAEFFIDKKRTLDIATLLIEQDLKIKWGAAVHPLNLDRLNNKEFELLKHSGASRLLIGAESGVEDELILVNKKTNKNMLKILAERCAKFDISASFTFVTGYPGMPSRNIQDTINFAAELAHISPIHETKVHFYAPYPGTPLYEAAKTAGFKPPLTLEEWAFYDYYEIVTPWVDKKWESIVRNFNEGHYPYIDQDANSFKNDLKIKVCSLFDQKI